MSSAGGRRKRLGVGGRVCMLTGKKKFKGFTRSFSEKKAKRWWRPNTHWKRLWWEKEQKFVRLYVSADAIKKVDEFGLEEMSRRAGLDLYAWSRPHWHPGSRQPLPLKVGYSNHAINCKKYWPDYMPLLNQGAALGDVKAPPPSFSTVGKLKKFKPRAERGPGTPPPPPKRLDVDKLLPGGQGDIV